MCKSTWWIYLMNITVFYLAPLSNAVYLVCNENACEMKTGLKGLLVQGNQKGLVRSG
jgi:hypothetical protein